eukprot:CAMPEP_0119476826 /NCGR_PEP_ID=MMETSP1344-20130328/7202_1 /TAXON_ID=236787 /ORGANISM="Florenciella parvula, Strain CCMP2471" /LENGTH=55 /DNA_ID=CAMNT_0007510685 /DNA_START=951 /DNA_END=1118 /DNA_ORIENTATION=-
MSMAWLATTADIRPATVNTPAIVVRVVRDAAESSAIAPAAADRPASKPLLSAIAE